MQTVVRWCEEYAGLNVNQLERLKELKQEKLDKRLDFLLDSSDQQKVQRD